MFLSELADCYIPFITLQVSHLLILPGVFRGGGGGKALTMATDSLESAPWSMVKMVILRSKFVVKSKVYHFDHRKFVFRPWSWSKWVFLWLNFVVKF